MNDEKVMMGAKVPKKVYEGLKEIIKEKEGMVRGLLGKKLKDAIILQTKLEKGEIEIVEK